MKAMILAAGRGERLRPLTDTLPKPLIPLGPHRLIEWHLHHLSTAGITDIVINVSHLADQIQSTLKDGHDYGVHISYSIEPEGALETGGGILNALPLLGDRPFLVINGDIWTDFPLTSLKLQNAEAHLVLVENPAHHPQGDFYLDGDRVHDTGHGQRYTFSGIGLYDPMLFKHCQPGRFPLAPLLRKAMQRNAISGEIYRGQWHDIGTPERLQTARANLPHTNNHVNE